MAPRIGKIPSARLLRFVASLAVRLAVGLASAVPTAQAVTVTFDAGAGRPEAYTEAGITVVPAANPEDHVHLGDNDGNGSPDLMLHPLCCSTPYQFTFSGGRFTPARLDFVLAGGTHTLTSSSGASLMPTASGTVTFPPDGWRGITLFTWRNDGVSIGEQGVIDNLRFCPGDCDDANGCTTDRCDPEDAGADPDGCIHLPNDDACDDGVFCNGPDRCSGGGCVVHAGDPCAGGPECADTCNEEAGNCFAPAAPAPASGEGEECEEDGDACTADVCLSGECVHERSVEPSNCTLLQDALRQALSLGIQVDGLITLGGADVPQELVAVLTHIREDLTAAARALGGKSEAAPVSLESTLRQRVRLALVALRRARPRIATFLSALSRPGLRARLGPEVAAEVGRRAHLLSQGVRALSAELRRLRRLFATFVRSRRRDAAPSSP
jgi:hypothetical protein